MLHAALAKNQIGVAVRYLFNIVHHTPELFSEHPDIGAYFGDRATLEQQMRRYVRVGEYNQDSGRAHALAAYCAWVLNDEVRLKNSMAAAERVSNQWAEKAQDRQLAANIRSLKFAMAAATR
jgi:hypothetical protein